ncbi:MAG: Ig-like domain-containing protein [Clostridia bacterium]|nr:Ig-like domain-containing protein [Clostridia bacterium]
MRRTLLIILALAFACALVSYAEKSAPRTITLSQSEITIDLAEGDSYTLSAEVTPESAGKSFKWRTSDSAVVTVEDGRITAHSCGSAHIYVSVHGFSEPKADCLVTVTDSRAPEKIVLYPSVLQLEPTRSAQIECVYLPQSARGEFVFSSSNTAAVQVDEHGLVTGVKPGTAVVTVKSAYSDSVRASVTISCEYKGRITDIRFEESSLELLKGESVPVHVSAQSEGGSEAYVFSSSDESVAAVDKNGVVHALSQGSAVISVYSYRTPSVSAGLPVRVNDPKLPVEISVSSPEGTLLRVGQDADLSIVFLPESADTGFTAVSSRPDIVSVNGSHVCALKRGFSVISVTSAYAPDLQTEIKLYVDDGSLCMEMPLRRTDESGIEANLARINAVEDCALGELDRLLAEGVIGAAERERRAECVSNAFKMYAFPWTVEKVTRYWRSANSENGAKNFKPGTIYYGLPYTSGVSHNRTYDTDRALAEGIYLPSQDGRYYVLNSELEDYGTGYMGSDCSSFIALALWGYTKYGGEVVKTNTLYYDGRLLTFKDASRLKPGDVLVRYSQHIVMFLYWADEAHTQAVFIQQGGSEPGINTVNTVMEELSDYTGSNYRLRRLAEF